MAQATTVIAPHPPADGRKWGNQCARCGSSMDFQECDQCAGEGYDVFEEDGDERDTDCEACNGRGGWWTCLSSPGWCNEHPNAGRENVQRGEIEWYTFDEAPYAAGAGGGQETVK